MVGIEVAYETNVQFYNPSMHPYCGAVVTQHMEYTDELVQSLVTHDDIARLNLWVLSRVEGDFSYPYGIPGSNMVFSIDERGLVRQIPTASGWISGNVGGAFEVHAGLRTDGQGVRDVHVEERERARMGPHLIAVIDAMHQRFARDGLGSAPAAVGPPETTPE